MRKILGNVALEAELQVNAAEEARRIALESLSLEEQAQLLDEANQCADEATGDLAEVDRVTEVSDALEDLALIAQDLKAPTQGEAALIGNSAQMAVAGTDISPDEIVPALESIDWSGKTEEWKKTGADVVATIKAKAKDIWEKIMSFLRRIWGQIREFFHRIFDTIPRLQKVLNEQLKSLAKAKAARTTFAPGSKLRMSVGMQALSMPNGGGIDAESLKTGLDSLEGYCDYVFGKYAPAVAARGTAIAGKIEGFTWEKALTSAEQVAAAAHETKFPMPHITSPSTAAGGDYVVSTLKSSIGGLQLVHKVVSESALAQSPTLRRLELLRGESVEIQRNGSSVGTFSGNTGGNFEVAALHADPAVELAKQALSVLKKLEGWKKDGVAKLEAVQKKLESASSKATGLLSSVSNAASTMKDGKMPTDLDVALYRGALNFNTAFTKWTAEPAISLTRGALASVRALTIVIDKSIAAMMTSGDVGLMGGAADHTVNRPAAA